METMFNEYVLIVDDEKSIRQSLTGIFRDEGYGALTAATGEEAIEIVRENKPDLVLLDIWLPDVDGIKTIEKMKKIHPDIEIIMISGHATIETAVKSTKLGAYDFLEKPLSMDRVLLAARRALEHSRLSKEYRSLKDSMELKYKIVGKSKDMKALLNSIDKSAPTNGRVLISGESGTGKELIARAIHGKSNRADHSFIEVNCAAIPEDLIESELFGHEKGSFTGALSRKKGKFEIAHQGTMFLDEIGDMSLKTQAKVLRVLEEQKFERIGGVTTIPVDVRVIAASNKKLPDLIKQGKFREDLYYRLNVIPIQIPPLRDRPEDIPILADHFLTLFSKEYGKRKKNISPLALELLSLYHWPGNVRELKNVIERLVIMCSDQIIQADEIELPVIDKKKNVTADRIEPFQEAKSLKKAREVFEKEFIEKQLQLNEWNVTKTAEKLKIERSNLHRKIKYYGLSQS